MSSDVVKPLILLVDDERSVLDALSRLLRKDFEVISAESGEKALKLLSSHPHVAIILSDYRMGEMNGVELLKKAKQMNPKAVRAILSGQMDLENLSQAINSAEIHRFILKPWDNEYLRVQMLEAYQTHWTLSERDHFQKLSETDPVTQLKNHRYFQEYLKQEFLRSQENNLPLSLLFIDVDHFKNFNDKNGHILGDQLLFEIARRIENKLSLLGQVSRYGGEEFGVVLPGIEKEVAIQKAEDLRAFFESEPFMGPFQHPTYVTISIGVSNFSQSYKTSSEMVDAADKALYQAKRQGRNQTVFAKSP